MTDPDKRMSLQQMRLHPWLNQAYETTENLSLGTSVCAENANSSTVTPQTMAANSALGNNNTDNNINCSSSSTALD